MSAATALPSRAAREAPTAARATTRRLGALRHLIAVCLIASGCCVAAGEIVIGQSAALTGNQAQFGRDAQLGVKAALDAANRQNVIAGQTLRLVSLDDGGRKADVLSNTQRLLDEHKPVALLGYTSGAGVEVTLPLLESRGVPMVGPLTGNAGIRQTFHRQLFHVRAGYGDEMERFARDLKAQGYSRFGIVYLNDVGPANAEAMRAALRSLANTKPTVEEAVDRNATSYEEVALRIVRAKPEAVLFIVNGAALSKIAIDLRKHGFAGMIVSSSFAGERFLQEAGSSANGVVLSQVLPPLRKHYLKIIKDLSADLLASGVSTQPNATILEAYVATRVLIEGLRRSARPTSREDLIAALESIRRLDLGGYEVGYRADDHLGSRFVDTAVVSRNALIN